MSLPKQAITDLLAVIKCNRVTNPTQVEVCNQLKFKCRDFMEKGKTAIHVVKEHCLEAIDPTIYRDTMNRLIILDMNQP